MIAFFDTSVHVELLRGRLDLDAVLARIEAGPVRLSPIVASELLRGATGRARRAVERLIEQLVPLEPPSWRATWLEAGRILPAVFRDHEALGLARLQNDVLLALTARHTGALFVSLDQHFVTLRRRFAFSFVAI
jgi:predicted nucleic acid-binding protein